MAFKDSKVDFSTKNKFTDELACFVSHEAGFVTTEGNEAASANMDELAEKAVIACKAKNQTEVKGRKSQDKIFSDEIKDAKREIKESVKQQDIRREQLEESRTELNKMIEENRTSSKQVYSKEQIDKKREEIKSKDRFIKNEDARIETRRTEIQRTKDKKAANKKSKDKAKKKAATKTSVASMLRAKKEIANGLASDKATGDAMVDGKSGLVGTVLEVINPLHYLKKWLVKLAASVAPMVTIVSIAICVIVMIIALLFDVLAPIAEVGEAISNFISIFTDDHVFTNEALSADKINEIIADSGCDETQEKVLRFALSKVSYPYSQAKRCDGAHFDCSSLAYYAWKEAGVDISFGTNYPPTAAEGAKMLNNAGKTVVSADVGGFDMKPGDLVYYGGSDNGRYKGIYHVAIYVGNGCAVEALNTEYGVVYQTLRTDKAIMVCRPNK